MDYHAGPTWRCRMGSSLYLVLLEHETMTYTIENNLVKFYDNSRFVASYRIDTLKRSAGPLMLDQWRIVSADLMDEIRGKL
jgi:hypothetical protein